MQQDLQPTPARWSFGKKLAFHFFFLFFVLYIICNPNGCIPFSDYVFEYYIEPFHQLIAWIAKNILNVPYEITVFTNGSGDTTYDYLVVLFLFVVSLAGAAIWTVLDRKRNSYNQLFYWLTVVVRYYVAFTMLTYGFVKVFKLQFPGADPVTLLQPYGYSSPMGLAWTFMGYSQGYNFFTGAGELIGGILLLFRRTTTLGAMVTVAVMGNVMAMNYSYDIPVKLLSTTLVVMSLWLMAKDFERLYNFFFINRTAAPSNITPPVIRKRAVRLSLRVFKFLLIGYFVVMGVYGSVSALNQYGDKAPKPPLWGIYNVETFVRNNDTIPPLQTDETRWKQLIVGGYRNYPRSHIRDMDDSLRSFVFKPDTTTMLVEMYPRRDTGVKNKLAYSYPDKEHLELRGRYNGDSIMVRMKIYDMNKFLLVNRGYHWINEYPFNR